MKKPTVAQAAHELNELVKQRLNSPQDGFLRVRITEFTTAVSEAITHLQQEVARLQEQQKQP